MAQVEIGPEAGIHGDPDRHLDQHREASQEAAGGIYVVLPVNANLLFLLFLPIVRIAFLDGIEQRFDGIHFLAHRRHVDLAGTGERVKDRADQHDQNDDREAVVVESDGFRESIKQVQQSLGEEVDRAGVVDEAAGGVELDDAAILEDVKVVLIGADRGAFFAVEKGAILGSEEDRHGEGRGGMRSDTDGGTGETNAEDAVVGERAETKDIDVRGGDMLGHRNDAGGECEGGGGICREGAGDGGEEPVGIRHPDEGTLARGIIVELAD